MWALADSHNGYFHHFQVYTGKEGSSEKQLGQRVVKNLMKGKLHHVFFNNYFTSEKLLCDIEKDIYACGTVLIDQRLSSTLKKGQAEEVCICMYSYVCVCVHVPVCVSK